MIFIPVANLIIQGYLAFTEAERAIPILETSRRTAPEARYHTTDYRSKNLG